jgi:hypothetical protein
MALALVVGRVMRSLALEMMELLMRIATRTVNGVLIGVGLEDVVTGRTDCGK